MRNSRDVLEVVCGVIETKENIESETTEIGIPLECRQICHNVFRITKHIVGLKSEAQISKKAKSIMEKNHDIILCAQKSVLRGYNMNKNFSGTAFLLGPNILATNWHVINSAVFPLYFSNSTGLSVESFNLHLEAVYCNRAKMEDVKLAKELSIKYVGYTMKADLHHPVERVEICKPRLDSVLGVTGDFDLFDFALINVYYPTMPKVLFVPSIHFVQPESNIATIGFPGTELMNQQLMKGLKLPSSYEASLPPFEYLKGIFYGFGKKCVSVGTSKAPFGAVNDQWTEVANFKADINQYSIASDETVFFGNSGGPVICLDNCKVHKVLDKNHTEWELVEFIGIHSGGEFVSCINCLQELPEKRKFENHFDLKICHSCRMNSKKEKTPLKYNYSLTVHHPDFVRCYKDLVLPGLKDLFQELPCCVREYINLHSEYF